MEDKYLDLLQHHPFQFAFPSSYKKNFLRILKAKLYPSEFTVATCDCLFPSTKIKYPILLSVGSRTVCAFDIMIPRIHLLPLS